MKKLVNVGLINGPSLLTNLHYLLVNFRERPCPISMGIKKVFLQVRVREEDQAPLEKTVWVTLQPADFFIFSPQNFLSLQRPLVTSIVCPHKDILGRDIWMSRVRTQDGTMGYLSIQKGHIQSTLAT
jgi:hypothetical protein